MRFLRMQLGRVAVAAAVFGAVLVALTPLLPLYDRDAPPGAPETLWAARPLLSVLFVVLAVAGLVALGVWGSVGRARLLGPAILAVVGGASIGFAVLLRGGELYDYCQVSFAHLCASSPSGASARGLAEGVALGFATRGGALLIAAAAALLVALPGTRAVRQTARSSCTSRKGVLSVSDHKNSPSRFRFSPQLSPTFGFRLQSPGADSTYSRSVLGARGNLEGAQGPCKGSETANRAICEQFNFPHFHSQSCSLGKTSSSRQAGEERGGWVRSLVLELDITRVIVRTAFRPKLPPGFRQ